MLFQIIQYIIDEIIRDPFTQISGFLAMWVILTAYFQKDDLTVKKLMLLSSLFWGTHFYLLWMYSGLAAVIIFVFRLGLSLKFQRSLRAFSSIIVVTLITWYFTFDGFISMLPIITSMMWAYSFFFLEKVKLRIAMMCNSCTWLIYHVYIWSLSGMVNEVFTQVILIVTIYRMLHPEWGTRYYAGKIKEILWKTSRPDYDRFIFIHDKVSNYRHTLWQKFHQIIHFDLRTFFKKGWKSSFLQKSWKLLNTDLELQKGKQVFESIISRVVTQK